MLDRDESALHDVQLSINRRATLDSPNLVLADIRDVNRIQDIFSLWRPQIVFHAAALKHLPLLEQHPQEAVKTNVWGTLTVLEAARDVAVDRFVNISTDKAANPISVLGYSKRLTERLTASVGAGCRGSFLSVRFGNVLGSRGSVLTAFASQIAAGRPVTVTHPDVTRYFMTVDEAVQLVIQAAAVGLPGEALVLDMGQPVRIDDVAKHLIRAAGADVDIDYIGLRSRREAQRGSLRRRRSGSPSDSPARIACRGPWRRRRRRPRDRPRRGQRGRRAATPRTLRSEGRPPSDRGEFGTRNICVTGAGAVFMPPRLRGGPRQSRTVPAIKN